MQGRIRSLVGLCFVPWLVIAGGAIAVSWGADLFAVLSASAGVLTVIGVAFFAVWSVLSNVTASFIIFFRFPLRIGDAIFLPEVDGELQGVVEEITLFHLLVRGRHGNVFAVPNNVVMQKMVNIYPGGVLPDDEPKGCDESSTEKEAKDV